MTDTQFTSLMAKLDEIKGLLEAVLTPPQIVIDGLPLGSDAIDWANCPIFMSKIQNYPPKMIERVARAICHEFNILHKPAYRLLSEVEQEDECANGADLWENEARAAIAAMCEPTEWMSEMATQALSESYDELGYRAGAAAKTAWQSYIAAALKEGQ